jgi:hypothetical protein
MGSTLRTLAAKSPLNSRVANNAVPVAAKGARGLSGAIAWKSASVFSQNTMLEIIHLFFF